MKKVYINEYGPRVSAAFYGFWRWTDSELLDLEKLKDIFLFAQDLGIDSFDLSHSSNPILVEEQVGKLIQQGIIKKGAIQLSTKIGRKNFSVAGYEGYYYDLQSAAIVKSVDETLARLHVDKIDFLILDHMDYIADMEEIASTLLKLQRSGKISYIGVSNFNVFQQRLLSNSLSQPIITNHLELNLLETQPLYDGRLDFIREQHSKVMAISPLAGGRILLGEDSRSVKLREALINLGKKYEANVEQIAVAWLYTLGVIPIIGSTEKRRIQNAATANAIQLSKEDWNYLYHVSRESYSI